MERASFGNKTDYTASARPPSEAQARQTRFSELVISWFQPSVSMFESYYQYINYIIFVYILCELPLKSTLAVHFQEGPFTFLGLQTTRRAEGASLLTDIDFAARLSSPPKK